MTVKDVVLYIGGFELPDRNAAAQRVIGIAKGLRELQYEVVFLNSIKNVDNLKTGIKNYYGFKCYEYKREYLMDYLFTAKTALRNIDDIKPNIVIAYNYPGFALERIRKYCKKKEIMCIADATEWYQVQQGSMLYRLIKALDTFYRMRVVHKKLDGVIAISRFLYDYYKDSTKTVMIPPTIDMSDEKWNVDVQKDENVLTFVYAGLPSAQKERLDLIVNAVEKLNVDKNVRLNIIGITKEEYLQMYRWKELITERIRFWGRVSHNKVIEYMKSSDWAIIIRDSNFVNNAGFPTKFVESISCGIPVIINRFSNVEEYANNENSILIENQFSILPALKKASKDYHVFNKNIFSFEYYLPELKTIIDGND